MRSGLIQNYWNQTETFEALKVYIDRNYDGLRELVTMLMRGGRVSVDITTYQNDMTTFHSKDDVFTLLIHLGYLGYDSEAKEMFIPNKEVLDVFKASTKSQDWSASFKALEESAEAGVAQIHRQHYPGVLEPYRGNILLISVDYTRGEKSTSPNFKHHTCVIEKA